MKILHFLIVFIANIYNLHAIDFEIFCKVLQDLASQITTHKIKNIVLYLTHNRDILDSMILFTKESLAHDENLLKTVITNLPNIQEDTIKVALFKGISMLPSGRILLGELNLEKDDQYLKKFAISINYRFSAIKYPEHLMLSFKATEDPEYIYKMLSYLDIDPQTVRPQLNTREIVQKRIADEEHKKLFESYVFFLETIRLLKENIEYPGVKEILTNIPDNLKTDFVKMNLSGIVDAEQDNM